MSMYRHAGLRVACVSCGVEEAFARMALAPRGGHWCWQCQMRAQIDEHHRTRPIAPLLTVDQRLRLRALLIVGGVAVGALLFGRVLCALFGVVYR